MGVKYCYSTRRTKNCYTSMLYKLMKVIAQEGLKPCILEQEGLFNSYVK